MAGYVIDENAVSAQTTEGDTASTRVAIDASVLSRILAGETPR